MQEPTVFTKIINGELPCHKVYEDQYCLAFMDIYPIQPGAVLVVSKHQVDHFFDVSPAGYTGLMQAVQRIAKAMKQLHTDVPRIGVIIEGFEVPHTHVKLVPIASGHELRRLPDLNLEPDHTHLAAQAAELTSYL